MAAAVPYSCLSIRRTRIRNCCSHTTSGRLIIAFFMESTNKNKELQQPYTSGRLIIAFFRESTNKNKELQQPYYLGTVNNSVFHGIDKQE